MTINPVSSNSLATTALDIRPATEQKEVKTAGREKEIDGDKDDNKSIAPKPSAATRPSVNASGQIIGTTISTKA